MSGFWRKLNHIERDTQHRIFTQSIDPSNIRTPGVNILKNSEHIIIVMMLKLKLQCPRQGNQD